VGNVSGLLGALLGRAPRRTEEEPPQGPSGLMHFPPYSPAVQEMVSLTGDPVRSSCIALAIETIEREQIPGAFAELGVYRGNTSRLIHFTAPDRTLYLFDTFSGFPKQDLAAQSDGRFRDTGLDLVSQAIGDTTNVVFKEGYFPETAAGLEHETFAFVLLDFDLYTPTRAAIEFFYPRVSAGGYVFAHDYNSPESDGAVAKALDPFLADKSEHLIAIPDEWGSVVFRKV
jgi:O-methyltransferase